MSPWVITMFKGYWGSRKKIKFFFNGLTKVRSFSSQIQNLQCFLVHVVYHRITRTPERVYCTYNISTADPETWLGQLAVILSPSLSQV